MRIVTKHGFKAPTKDDLNNYELGYSVDNRALYIKDPVNGIVQVGYNIDESKLREILSEMNISGSSDADLTKLNLKLDGTQLKLLNDSVILSSVDFNDWFDGGAW